MSLVTACSKKCSICVSFFMLSNSAPYKFVDPEYSNSEAYVINIDHRNRQLIVHKRLVLFL